MLQEFHRETDPQATYQRLPPTVEEPLAPIIARCRLLLGITSGQDHVWQSFADVVVAVGEGAATLSHLGYRASGARFCIIQSIKQLKFLSTAKLAALKRLQRAVRDLYWILSPHQRVVADRQLAAVCTACLRAFSKPWEATRDDA